MLLRDGEGYLRSSDLRSKKIRPRLAASGALRNLEFGAGFAWIMPTRNHIPFFKHKDTGTMNCARCSAAHEDTEFSKTALDPSAVTNEYGFAAPEKHAGAETGLTTGAELGSRS